MERHILVVLPHPDDETFGCGGTIALHTAAGTPVTYVCGTLGEMGRNMGRPFFANRETLRSVREKELRDACEALGIRDLRMLGLRDKTVEFEDIEVLSNRILEIILELRPSLIITHYPGYGVHPDHNALARATVRAVEKLPIAERPPIYAMAITRERFKQLGQPDVEIDIQSVSDKKMEAIRAHRSQSEGMMSLMASQAEKDPVVKQQFEQRLKKEIYWIYPL